MHFFWSSEARDQLPGIKIQIDSPLPESWNLNPKAMNTDLKSINKQTKHCIYIFFEREHIFTEFDYEKQRQVIRLRLVFKKQILCPAIAAFCGGNTFRDCPHSWTIIRHNPESWSSWQTILLWIYIFGALSRGSQEQRPELGCRVLGLFN